MGRTKSWWKKLKGKYTKKKKEGKRKEGKRKKTRKHAKKTRKLRKEKCSPTLDSREFSCYSNEQLHEMKLLWNKQNPDRPILTNTPQDIHARLDKYLSDKCDKESCWYKQDFMKKYADKVMKKNTFAPDAPDSWSKNKS